MSEHVSREQPFEKLERRIVERRAQLETEVAEQLKQQLGGLEKQYGVTAAAFLAPHLERAAKQLVELIAVAFREGAQWEATCHESNERSATRSGRRSPPRRNGADGRQERVRAGRRDGRS